MKPLPKLVKKPIPRFYVDGDPFLILGLQWDCNTCHTPIEMVPLFKEAARLGCNTAVTPLYWYSIEPEPGEYDFTTVDLRLQACREAGLRLILLWFASYKNAGCYYAPKDIREDNRRYRKVVLPTGELQDKTPCPNCAATLERDRLAFVELMKHLKNVDEERTVIMVQCENEPGILGADRCYCKSCNQLFEQGGRWNDYGARQDEAFAAWSLARFIDQICVAGKEVYDIPIYANAALGGYPGQKPGIDYFAAGPIEHFIEIWQEAGPNIDLIAPDIYQPSYPAFSAICKSFRRDGNPLFIAETSTDLQGRTERNVFYAIGSHGAIGFDPWAIDRCYVDWFAPPFVRRVDLNWGPKAVDMLDSYRAIGRANKQIASATGTELIRTFVQEPGDRGASFELGGFDWRVSYPYIEGAGRGFLIDRGNGEFLIAGVNFMIQPFSSPPAVERSSILRVERGHFEGDDWRCHAWVVQENGRGQGPIRVEEGQVIRVWLSCC